MPLKSQVIFRDLPRSISVETQVRKKIKKLSQFCNEIMHCDVEISQARSHPHQGKLYHTRVTISVPGKEIVATHKVNQDVYVSIRDTFNAARRQLQDYMRKRRGHVKTHDLHVYGQITSLLADDRVGFISSAGNEYYFTHDNTHEVEFDNLEEGMIVSFVPSVDKVGHRAERVSLPRRTTRQIKH